MKNYISALLFSMLLLNSGVASASNRSASEGYNYWIELGLVGRSFSHELDGNGMAVKLSLSKDRNIISFRNLYH